MQGKANDWASPSGSPTGSWAWRLCCSFAPHWAHSPSATTLSQATSGWRKGKFTWPYSGQQRKLPLFLDMVVVLVRALCLCRFWPLVDILERWAKRWSSCPPEEDDLIKDRFCQLQPHSAVYRIVHPKWLTTSCLSQPTGPGSPTGCFLSTREQDLEITCRVQAEQAGRKSGPGQGFEGFCFLAVRI